jgi:outer membrane immunogenic protein
MRRILLASLLPVAFAAAPAWSQTSVFNWSGVYVGAHAGYGWGMTEHGDFGYVTDGGLAGGQIGFNRQIGNFVFGLEGELSWSNLRGNLAIGNYFGAADLDSTSQVDWLATVTGRVGVAQGSTLIYAKGGVVWAGMQHGSHLIANGALPAAFDFFHRTGEATHPGWTLGGGIEHAFAPNWSARLEYGFVSLPMRGVALAGPSSAGGTISTTSSVVDLQQSLHLVKLGVNYHFGGPPTAPAIAPTPPGGFDWTGFYLGLHAGYSAGRATWIGFDPDYHLDLGGGLAGGQAGYNLQVGRVVFGAEFDLAWTGISEAFSTSVVEPILGATSLNLTTRTQWLGTAAGRIGFAQDGWLLFGKLGVAVAHQRHAWDQNAPGLLEIRTSGRHHHVGVLVGAGVEYAVTRNWSVKAEYDFIDLGRESITVVGTAAGLINGNVFADPNIRQQMHIGKLGVNYRFAPP